MSRSQSPLPFIERPYTELVRLAWPIAVSFVSYATMTLVGTLFVGRIGPAALAAVGLGGVAVFTLHCFGLGAVRSVKVIISQAVGAGQKHHVRNWVGGVVAFAAALSFAALLSGPALARLLELLASDRETGERAAQYLVIRNFSAPFVLIAAALREVRYGLSDSRTPMRAAVVANLTNIALDAWFVLGLGWGVAGVALAAVFSCALELLLLVGVQRSAGFGLREFGAAELKRLWALGWPLGLQFLLEVGAFATLVAILARIGQVDLAAHQVALQLVHFAFLPALAIGEAASVLSGQAVGAGLDREVRRIARYALHVAGAYTGSCALVLAIWAGPLAAAFTDDVAVRSLAVKLLYVAAVFQLGDGANVVARGVLRGAGDVRFSAALSVITAWVTTPPLTLLLGVTLGLGALGGWLGLCVEILLGAAVLWQRLVGGQWLSAAQRSRDELRGEMPAATVPALTEPA